MAWYGTAQGGTEYIKQLHTVVDLLQFLKPCINPVLYSLSIRVCTVCIDMLWQLLQFVFFFSNRKAGITETIRRSFKPWSTAESSFLKFHTSVLRNRIENLIVRYFWNEKERKIRWDFEIDWCWSFAWSFFVGFVQCCSNRKLWKFYRVKTIEATFKVSLELCGRRIKDVNFNAPAGLL